MLNERSEYFTVEELLSLDLFRHLKPSTLSQWRHKKTGPRFVSIGRKVFYERVEVDRWIEQKKREANGPMTESTPVLPPSTLQALAGKRPPRLGGHITKAERREGITTLSERAKRKSW